MSEVSTTNADVSTVIRPVVVMGVAGSGKSTVARALANALGMAFIDADRFHSPENRAKMAAGHPLDDDDRGPWLRAVGGCILEETSRGVSSVTACSALRRAYRDELRGFVASLYFVVLDGPPEVVRERLALRHHDFMPASLLASQFAMLEPLEDDEEGVRVDLTWRVGDIVRVVVRHLARDAGRD